MKNTLLKFISCLLSLLLVFSVLPVSAYAATYTDKVAVSVGDMQTVKLNANSKVTWSISDDSIVSGTFSGTYKENATFKAKKAGSAVVTCKTGGNTYKVTVVVSNRSRTITTYTSSKTVYYGETVTCKVSTASKKLTWKSSNSDVVALTSTSGDKNQTAVFKCKQTGTTTLSIKESGGATVKVNVTVKWHALPTLSYDVRK